MKKNININTFLILLGLIIIPSFISAQEAEIKTQAEVKVDTGSLPPPPAPQNLGVGKVNVNDISITRAEVKREIKDIREDGQKEREELRGERRGQVEAVRQNASSTTQRPPAELKVLREQNKNEIDKIRADFSSTIKSNRASTTAIIKEKREDLIKGIQEKRELFKEELEAKKEMRASTTAAIKAKFKEGLAKIKDEKKKEKVENVSGNLTELNTKITTRSVENINKIEEVLIAIESRADKANANGVDVSNIRSLITIAEAAIADARTAITNQTGKTYTVSIASESTVKTSLETTRDLLKKDIEAMNVKIKTAHEAVRKAANTLKTIPKVNAEVIATSTATTTN